MESKQEIDLIDKIAGGDRDAENELFLRFAEEIKCVVRIRAGRVVSPEDQQDIASEVQQAMLVSLRKGSFDISLGKQLGAYIAGIAVKTVGQYFRRKDRERLVNPGLPDEPPGDSRNTLSGLIDEERDEKLRKYLNKLKPKYKKVLLLRVYEKRSIEEIADILNLEHRRVSERIHYAVKLLLKECEKENYFSIFLMLPQIYI